ncbi:hypothetical protein SD80_027425 [Scytonema tolypothrichoides VB-61278]|nr:hypothetical protein SD80_027425 [Scytonema tolypothrichoides VB-61278]
MTINSEIDRDRAPIRSMQIGFYATSVVFNLCLIAQLLTVGVAYFVNPAWWDIHVWLVSDLAPRSKTGFIENDDTCKPLFAVHKPGFLGLVENGARCE